MKKIGFITKNRVLAQSLASLIKGNLDLPFEPFVIQNINQAVMDAEILEINVAVIEMPTGTPEETDKILELCKQLRITAPVCQILLLVPQGNKDGRDLAMSAVNSNIVNDYVFLDTSLDYLLAKLLAI